MLKDRDRDVAKLFVADPTNPEESFFRYNRTGNKFQEYLSGVWTDKVLSLAGGGTGQTTPSGIRTSLGLGTMALQNDTAVDINGGDIASAVTINTASIVAGTMNTARLGSGAGGVGDRYLADNSTWKTIPGDVPIGVIFIWLNNTPPAPYICCWGQVVSRAAYAGLFAVIGTTYGAGDGSTTFNLPDFRGVFPLGQTSSGPYWGLNIRGGALGHTHGIYPDGAHSHIAPSHQHNTDVHSHGAGSYAAASHSHGGIVGGETDSEAGHSHTFSDTSSGPSTGGTNPTGSGTNRADINHTHTISGTTSTSGSHSHHFEASIPSSSPAVSGTSGSGGGGLTSAAGGTATDTVAAHSHAGITTPTDPPYMTVNFIIKAS